MDPTLISGIPEIDVQHDDIHRLVDLLRDALSNKDRRHLIHSAVKRLHQMLVTHFEYEEALMGMVQYTELPLHTKMHKGVLKLFENYLDNPPKPNDHEHLVKLLTDKVLGHIMEHDQKLTELVKRKIGNEVGARAQ